MSTLGTLVVSVSTLLILPAGLLAFGVAVLIDKDLSAPLRGLPLVATLAFLFGPALIAVLPKSASGVHPMAPCTGGSVGGLRSPDHHGAHQATKALQRRGVMQARTARAGLMGVPRVPQEQGS